MNMNIPKIFWKYYDLYRRKMITLSEYATLSGIRIEMLTEYLDDVTKNQ